jgi:hypothetical protein
MKRMKERVMQFILVRCYILSHVRLYEISYCAEIKKRQVSNLLEHHSTEFRYIGSGKPEVYFLQRKQEKMTLAARCLED